MQVDSEWNRGNHQGAHKASRMARNWAIAGIITGAIIGTPSWVVFIVLGLLYIPSSPSDSSNYDDY